MGAAQWQASSCDHCGHSSELQRLLDRASTFKADGKHEAAIKEYDKAIDLWCEHAAAFRLRADAKVMIRDFQGAAMDYDRAISLGCESTSAVLFRRGSAKEKIGDYKGAVDDLSEVIHQDPTHAPALSIRGEAQGKLRKFRAATDDLDRAIELEGMDPCHFYRRARVKKHTQDWDGVNRDLDRAIQLQPDSATADVFRDRAKARERLDDCLGAMMDRSKAAELDGMKVYDDHKALELVFRPASFCSRAVAKMNLGNLQGALEDLNMSLDLNSNDSLAHRVRGDLKKKLGDGDDCAAKGLNPDDAAWFRASVGGA